MRRWQLTILSIVIVFVVVVVGAIGKSGSSQAVLSVGKNATQPVLIAQNSNPTRFMPLGDSITQGEGNQNSYRRLLWFNLRNACYNVDFVGSLQRNCQGYPLKFSCFAQDIQTTIFFIRMWGFGGAIIPHYNL